MDSLEIPGYYYGYHIGRYVRYLPSNYRNTRQQFRFHLTQIGTQTYTERLAKQKAI